VCIFCLCSKNFSFFFLVVGSNFTKFSHRRAKKKGFQIRQKQVYIKRAFRHTTHAYKKWPTRKRKKSRTRYERRTLEHNFGATASNINSRLDELLFPRIRAHARMMGCCIKIRKFFLFSLSVLTTELSHSHKNLSLSLSFIKLNSRALIENRRNTPRRKRTRRSTTTVRWGLFFCVCDFKSARACTHTLLHREGGKTLFFSRESPFCLKMDQFSLVT